MKTFSFIMKYLIVPISSLIGLLYAFDTYIIERASTVVRPTQIRVDSIKTDVEEIKVRTRNIESILMQRK